MGLKNEAGKRAKNLLEGSLYEYFPDIYNLCLMKKRLMSRNRAKVYVKKPPKINKTI